MSSTNPIFIFTALLITPGLCVTQHNNEVDFTGAVLDFCDSMKLGAITSGQPFTGPPTCDGQSDKMVIKAGRKKDHTVANSFLQGVTVNNILGLQVKSDKAPAELNFYVEGDFQMQVTNTPTTDGNAICRDFRIAQGNNGSNNNWWIASPNCARAAHTDNYLFCTCDKSVCPNKDCAFNAMNLKITAGGASNEFKVEYISEASPKLVVVTEVVRTGAASAAGAGSGSGGVPSGSPTPAPTKPLTVVPTPAPSMLSTTGSPTPAPTKPPTRVPTPAPSMPSTVIPTRFRRGGGYFAEEKEDEASSAAGLAWALPLLLALLPSALLC